MEDLGSNRFDGIGNAVRRKRSQTSRRPRPDSQPIVDDLTPSSTPPLDDPDKASSDENDGYVNTGLKRKEFNLNHCVTQPLPAVGWTGLHNRRSSEGVLAPANWKGSSSKFKDVYDSESKNADVYGGRNPEGNSLGQFGVSQEWMD